MQNGYDSGTARFRSSLDDVKGLVLRHASLYSVSKVEDEACYPIGFMNPRSVTPSELKNFAFCQRAWLLGRQVAHSLLVIERARGREDHESHGTAVQQAQRGTGVGALLLAVGAGGIVAAILLWLTR